MIDPVCNTKLEPGQTKYSTTCGTEVVCFCSKSCMEKFVCDPKKKLVDYVYDTIIIGGGPAGLSAGIYAGLGGLESLFLSKALGGQAWDSTEVRNFPGFDFISGPELVKRFTHQLFEDIKLSHKICGVSEVRKIGRLFEVETEEGDIFRSKTVLLTTGMKRRKMNIPGEAQFSGKGVNAFHAMSAAGFAGKQVVVVGGGNSAAQAALGLKEAGAQVVVVTRSFRPDQYLIDKVTAAGIPVEVDLNPARVEGESSVTAFVGKSTRNGEEKSFPCQAVFVEIGLVPNSDLYRELAVLNQRGEIHIDSSCRTGLPGLFAAGDVADTPGKRILIAAGEGAKAVLAIEEYLENFK